MNNVGAVEVLARLGSARWRAAEATAYEVALEGVRQAIGYYAHLIATEEAEAERDVAAITQWRAEQAAWAERGEALTPSDGSAIKRIRSDADDLLSADDDQDDDDQDDDGDDPIHDSYDTTDGVGDTGAPEQATDDRYLLDAAESARIFRDRIVPDLLTGATQAQPIVVFIGGQPGDGKATVTALARAVLAERGRPIVVSATAYEPYHPRFYEPITDVPPAAGRYVAADGRRWYEQAVEWAMRQRHDVIVEIDLSAPEEFADCARAFKNAGFQVEVALLAVHEALSRLGVLERHLRALENFGFGRLTTQGAHDAGYVGVLRAADLIDAGDWGDRIAVLRPDAGMIYGNQRTSDSAWQEPARTAEAISRERDRPWTVVESRNFLETASELGRFGLSAPVQWIRDESLEDAKTVTAIAGPRLHPDAVTMHVATAGTRH
ncbi:zeta toxin family protein [Kribbella sp. NPDC004536]|uniref:zeta toxin family protein n=1 Tax=Kribbella sp. NPDC004536 TaxID=3364106 RepID=UPI0036B20F57